MSSAVDFQKANAETQAAWEENADFWDQVMGEGNDFVNVLIWPATERLLAPSPGDKILDIACGNGLYARKLAALGAEVVAIDFSAAMLERARRHTTEHDERIRYLSADVTDEAKLRALPGAPFDAAVCPMALFDIADIGPIMRALPALLRPGALFVFSLLHPCFNSPHMAFVAESEDREGDIVTSYSVKIFSYMTSSIARGAAIPGQPKPQVYFHRPISAVFNAAFEQGFVMDGMEERAFPADHPQSRNPLSWGRNFSEIPPVLVARMRLSE